MLAMKCGGFLLPFSAYSPRFLGSERYKEGLTAGLGHEDLALHVVWQRSPCEPWRGAYDCTPASLGVEHMTALQTIAHLLPSFAASFILHPSSP